jgi:Zn-dependent alcohol dehydrogenase
MLTSRAAVCRQAGQPLTIETIEVAPPKEGEVLLEIKATGVCHTDAAILWGVTRNSRCRPSSATKAPASSSRSVRV